MLNRWKIGKQSPSITTVRATMSRDEFRTRLFAAFGENHQAANELRDLANTAQRVAWGTWKADDGSGQSCHCPLGSIAQETDGYFADAEDVRALSGYGNWDVAMSNHTRHKRGILSITD